MTTPQHPAPAAQDPVLALLDHNEWGNDRVINACTPLTDAQLDHEFAMGLVTLRRTITHTIAAMRLWSDRLGAGPVRPWLDTPDLGPAAWADLNREASAELRRTAFAGPMDETIEIRRDDQVWRYPRAHLIVHVATHGVHHRAQCLNMLRRLGTDAESLPPGSTLRWSLSLNGPPAARDGL